MTYAEDSLRDALANILAGLGWLAVMFVGFHVVVIGITAIFGWLS